MTNQWGGEQQSPEVSHLWQLTAHNCRQFQQVKLPSFMVFCKFFDVGVQTVFWCCSHSTAPPCDPLLCNCYSCQAGLNPFVSQHPGPHASRRGSLRVRFIDLWTIFLTPYSTHHSTTSSSHSRMFSLFPYLAVTSSTFSPYGLMISMALRGSFLTSMHKATPHPGLCSVCFIS